MKNSLLAAGVCALLLLTGCKWMNDDKGLIVKRSDDYLDAKPAPPVEVPEDLSASSIVPLMAVPDLPPEAGTHLFADDVPRPEAIYAKEEDEGVRIQKLGERRWLLVPQSPAVVWPKVKQFFADNGVAVAAEDPDAGRLDTEWITPANADTKDVIRLAIRAGREADAVKSGRDRLKVLVEQGIRERTSEIHLRYENDSLQRPVEGFFPPASDAVDVEAEVIREIGSYVASNVADQSVSFVARHISTQAKAELVRGEGDRPTLRLALDFNRAWALVNQSLTDAGVPIKDVDRSNSVVYAEISQRILNKESKPGWFKRLVTIDEKKRPIEVRMHAHESVQDVQVFEAGGQQPLPNNTAEQVLLLIREFAT